MKNINTTVKKKKGQHCITHGAYPMMLAYINGIFPMIITLNLLPREYTVDMSNMSDTFFTTFGTTSPENAMMPLMECLV